MLGKKKRTLVSKRAPRPQRVRYPVAVLFRMFVLGSVAVLAALWALWRHYTVPLPPMVTPAATEEIEIDVSP